MSRDATEAPPPGGGSAKMGPGASLFPACNICGSSTFTDMAPNPDSIFVRRGVQCAACGSLERHRLLYELLNTRGYLDGARRVFHVAPEIGLARLLHAHFGDLYMAVDIDPARYEGVPVRRFDLCHDLAALEPASFDIVIHNHVLEHVACDYQPVLRALDALVAPGGVHAFSLPFMEGGYREDLSDIGDAARLARFGQTDHVRMFSPSDVMATVGTLVDLPDHYDATRLVSPARLSEINIPEAVWRGFNNNAVFFIEKAPGPVRSIPDLQETATTLAEARRPAVLFVSANGVGRGHITRQLAIARRLKKRRPVFLTMSYAARLVAKEGHLVQFTPHHKATGENPERWHEMLAHEIETMLDRTGADTLVYDVNFVFDGVIEVLRRRPSLRSIWVRRAMWPEHHRAYLGAGMHFDHIVEPGDLAEVLDRGPTVDERDTVMRVPPVLRTEPSERLARAAAREALDLEQGATVVMLDLMQTSIEAYARLRDTMLSLLQDTPSLVVLELEPALADASLASRWPLHRIVALDDAYRHSLAWDAAILRCGYNSFQENLLGAVPSLFVPNTQPDMDDQAARARWARENGLALDLAADADGPAVKAALTSLLDPHWRKAASEAMQRLQSVGSGWTNGADAIASLIDEP
jgi:UDP:flavonoid glycosyltransferase YjiC (YdhE family)